MRVKYEGPVAGLDVVGPDGKSYECKRGETVDVPKELGDELVARGDWTSAETRPTRRAETRETEGEE